MSKNETKIRRVKAKDNTEVNKPKISKYAAKVAGVKTEKPKKKLPKWLKVLLIPFKFVGKILLFVLKPFAPIGKYIKNSWEELKLVRWPTRKETWKMTGAVIAFSVAFAILVLLFDGLFNWIFKVIIGK